MLIISSVDLSVAFLLLFALPFAIFCMVPTKQYMDNVYKSWDVIINRNAYIFVYILQEIRNSSAFKMSYVFFCISPSIWMTLFMFNLYWEAHMNWCDLSKLKTEPMMLSVCKYGYLFIALVVTPFSRRHFQKPIASESSLIQVITYRLTFSYEIWGWNPIALLVL